MQVLQLPYVYATAAGNAATLTLKDEPVGAVERHRGGMESEIPSEGAGSGGFVGELLSSSLVVFPH